MIKIAVGDVEGSADVGDAVGIDAFAIGDGDGDDGGGVEQEREAEIKQIWRQAGRSGRLLGLHRGHFTAFLRALRGPVG